MYIVYILKSKLNGSYYIGCCENIDIRLKKHNDGLVPSTKRYIPWSLIWTEEFESLSGARTREAQIKNWKKRSAIEKLIRSKI